MKALIKNEIDFLKSLSKTKRIRYFRGSKIQKIGLVFTFYLLLKLLIASSIGFSLFSLFPQIEEAYSIDIELNFEGFFIIVLFVPFLEELIFRLPLKLSIFRFHTFLLIIALSCFFINTYLGFVMLIICAISMNLFINKKYFKFIKMKWLQYKVEIFLVFSFLFGLIHAANFDADILPWYVFPFVFLPQLFGGLVTGILRLRFGFFYGLLLHSIYNGSLMLFDFFTES